MNINTITAEDLRRMPDKEGLILQGCGGDLTEWVDGINEMLTKAGISFRCGGLSIERNQKPLAPKITLVATHHDRQKQVEVKRSSCVNPHEIRLFSGCPYAVVK